MGGAKAPFGREHWFWGSAQDDCPPLMLTFKQCETIAIYWTHPGSQGFSVSAGKSNTLCVWGERAGEWTSCFSRCVLGNFYMKCLSIHMLPFSTAGVRWISEIPVLWTWPHVCVCGYAAHRLAHFWMWHSDSLSYLHKPATCHYRRSPLDIHIGSCQPCWYTRHFHRPLGSPDIHRYLETEQVRMSDGTACRPSAG